MTHLNYEGGPLSTTDTGTVYPLQPNQVAPLSIMRKEWGGGKYVLIKKPQPVLGWVEAK